MSKERDIVLLQLGFGILLYVLAYNLVNDSADLLPECKIYHETQGKCEVWVEKVPGRSVIQD